MGKSPAASWCFFRDNQKLKNILKYKITQKGLNYKLVAKATNLSASRISKYFNGVKHGRLNQYQLVTLCKFLGIEVDLSIKINE